MKELSEIFQNKEISIGDVICGVCKMRVSKSIKKKEMQSSDDDSESNSSNESINGN